MMSNPLIFIVPGLIIVGFLMLFNNDKKLEEDLNGKKAPPPEPQKLPVSEEDLLAALKALSEEKRRIFLEGAGG